MLSSNLFIIFLAEAIERLTDSQRTARIASLVPFFKLDSLSPPQLVSIGNFLRTELSTLSHATRYYAGQYEYVLKQLEDVNNQHFKKLNINGSDTSSDPGPSNSGASGGAQSVSADVIVNDDTNSDA
jgi:hypothetical protein